MKYALLLYAVPPDARTDESPAAEGVFDNWVNYTQALKDAGVLLGAEQLTAVSPSGSSR